MLTNFVALKSVLSLWTLLVLGISIKRISSTLVVGVTDDDGLFNGTDDVSVASEQSQLGYAESSCGKEGDSCGKYGKCIDNKCHCYLNFKRQPLGSGKYGCLPIDCKKTADCTQWHINTECNVAQCVCANGFVLNSDGYECISETNTNWILIAIGVIVVVIILAVCLYFALSSNKNKQAQNVQASTPQAPSRAQSSASGFKQQVRSQHKEAAPKASSAAAAPHLGSTQINLANGYPSYGANSPMPV